MKKLLLLLFIIPAFYLNSQTVLISEIMYNPPDIGQDTFEYIEIMNPDLIAVDMTGWQITSAVEFTFPAFILNPGDYVVVAKDSARLFDLFGVEAFQWDISSLNNSGELIQLFDDQGSLIDAVEYADTDPWPPEADGQGNSLEFCNPDLDNNNGENWVASRNATGVFVDGEEVFGSPGAMNCFISADVDVELIDFEFLPADITIQAGQTVKWINEMGVHNVNGTQQTYPSNPESFTSGLPAVAPWVYTHTFTESGFYNYQCDPHVAVGMFGTVTVVGELYPDRDISEVTTINTNGVADSLGVLASLTGVVHGINFSQSGYKFHLIEPDGDGITVFSFDPVDDYEVTEGDRITVEGEITQFNGLIEIVPESIEVLSTDNPLVAPREVTELGENTESEHIMLTNVSLVNPSEWVGDGSSFNVTATNDFGMFTIRVESQTPLSNSSPPTGTFDITGYGTQFDSSSPYFDGYQILPIDSEDIILGIKEVLPKDAVTVYPMPTSDRLYIESNINFNYLEILNVEGKRVNVISEYNNTGEVDVSGLPFGTYLLILQNNKEIYKTSLIIR